VVAVSEPEALPGALAVVAAEIAACDRACSRFRADSDISRLNAGAGRPVDVSARLLDELAAALRAARLTDGLVDPTIGRALIRLGYDRDFTLLAAAAGSTPLAFTAVPGWQCVEVDPGRGRARVPAGVVVDLGATAKARCADLAAAAAADATGSGVLVSLGGDVAVAGAPPGRGWDVLVTDDSSAHAGAPSQTVKVLTGGLATSGVTVRTWHRGGTALHHIIDPRTGRPARVVWRAVSAAAATSTDANIASTAAVVLGADAPAWLEERQLPSRLVAPDGSVTRVAGWPPPSTQMAQEVA
jgi:thiamine biosynthesis lipoprotein